MSGRGGRRRARAWWRRQLHSFFSSLGTLWSHRLGTAMTVLVLGIAMALPLGLYVAVQNLRAVDLQQDNWGTMTVFLEVTAGEAEATALAGLLGETHAADVQTVSPEQGMADFRAASGFGAALDVFDENPLPWVLQVTPADGQGQALEESVSTLAAWLEERPEVDFVQVDHKWLQRLAGLLELGEALVTVLTALLALAVVVVVANTIRLDVANRANEIQVLNLVGAPDGFIRQPFLYSGFWYGLAGAALALLLLAAAMAYLSLPLERLLDAYGNHYRVHGIGWRTTVLVLPGGGLLGLVGSWMAVRRHLRQFRLAEPARKK